jgi:hypothetical protein
MRYATRAALVCLLLYVGATAFRIYSRKLYLWLPAYARWAADAREKPQGPIHIFFLYADHFEPGDRVERTRRWAEDYPKLASRHRDSSGRPVQHTWFYPGEQPQDENMKNLQKLAVAGYGEVELHYHHGNDTQDSTRRKFQEAIAYFQKFGFLKTVDGKTQFAFIHGDWGLDNSDGPAFCGANRELDLLKDLGCFGDFTFPSLWDRAQPAVINSIYEAIDDDRPKSYNSGNALAAGRAGGGLLLFEGPLVIAPALNPGRLFLWIEDGNIHPAVPLTQQRVDLWIQANVHVIGRPEWVFVKAYGHSASTDEDMDETLGADYERALSHLENRYNDRVHYVLHYVTAREAYNLARAAAAGKRGDPEQYMNWLVPPYESSRP